MLKKKKKKSEEQQLCQEGLHGFNLWQGSLVQLSRVGRKLCGFACHLWCHGKTSTTPSCAPLHGCCLSPAPSSALSGAVLCHCKASFRAMVMPPCWHPPMFGAVQNCSGYTVVAFQWIILLSLPGIKWESHSSASGFALVVPCILEQAIKEQPWPLSEQQFFKF